MGPSVLVHPSTLALHEPDMPAATCNNTVNVNTAHTHTHNYIAHVGCCVTAYFGSSFDWERVVLPVEELHKLVVVNRPPKLASTTANESNESLQV